MSKRIKGITIELDGETKGLDKALGDVNKRSRDVNKELRDVEKLLKFNPGNTQLVAQKQKLLGEQVSITRDRLKQLKAAEAEVQRQFENGEIGEEQYRAFQRELVETESKLKHFESQLQQTPTKFERFSTAMHKAGDKMKDVGKKAKDTGMSLTKFVTAPIMAGGAALVALAKASGESADRILDLSEITGMSTDAIQEWQHVSTVAGVEQEAMTKAVEGLVRKIPQLEAEGGKATEALKKMGVSYSDLKKMSPDQQIDTLMRSLSQMEDPLERNAIGSQLFGGAWKDIAPILGMGADGIERAKEEARELGVVMGEDSLNDANNFRIELDKLTEVFKKMFMQIGADLAPMLRDTLAPIIQDTVIPALQSMAEKVKEVLEWFKELSPQTQTLIVGAIGLAAALGPLLTAFGMMSMGMGSVLKIIPTLVMAVGSLGKALMFLAVNPVGLVITAIGLLVAAGIWLYQNWDTVKATIINIWNVISIAVGNFIKGLVATIKSWFGKAKEIIVTIFTAISTFFNKIWSGIKSFLGSIVSGIVSFFSQRFNSVKTTITNVFNAVNSFIRSIWSGIRSFFGSIVSGIVSTVTGRFGSLLTGIRNTMNKIRSTISNIWNNVMSFFRGINLWQIGKDIINGLINGIKSMAKKVVNSVKGVVDGAIQGAKNLLGIASPSKVFKKFGEYTGQGFEQGMTAMVGKVKNAAEKMGDAAFLNLPKDHEYTAKINANTTTSGASASPQFLLAEIGKMLAAQMQSNQSGQPIYLTLDGKVIAQSVVGEVTRLQDHREYRRRRSPRA
ncbi:hypothetical protein [Shouchella lonarensis]|uniref:Phage-related minor tail protein n=1 Tax=Shouchella lonarensis TaxID=1464122 RepID=A0A1G6III7_9BACI|nr:hypothetical protein [Shouchella lonarensis]SDC06337.1 Phage-related minor tail protein [Shouchella lonarensis]